MSPPANSFKISFRRVAGRKGCLNRVGYCGNSLTFSYVTVVRSGVIGSKTVNKCIMAAKSFAGGTGRCTRRLGVRLVSNIGLIRL